MKLLMSSFRNLVVAFLLFPMLGVVSHAGQAPNADMLLKAVRRGATSVEGKEVGGQLRKRGVKVPFNINLRGNTIIFQYQPGGQWERFDLLFKDKGQEIKVMKDGRQQRLPVGQYAQPIAGTDVSFEDLSMRFLYWPNGTVLPQDGSSEVKGRDCWVVQVKNPTPKVGQYEWARVWIDKENGAMWQIDGIAANGELSKRFIMDSVMKLKDGSWFFKKMKLEVRDPANSQRTQSVSYIEMNSPK